MVVISVRDRQVSTSCIACIATRLQSSLCRGRIFPIHNRRDLAGAAVYDKTALGTTLAIHAEERLSRPRVSKECQVAASEPKQGILFTDLRLFSCFSRESISCLRQAIRDKSISQIADGKSAFYRADVSAVSRRSCARMSIPTCRQSESNRPDIRGCSADNPICIRSSLEKVNFRA